MVDWWWLIIAVIGGVGLGLGGLVMLLALIDTPTHPGAPPVPHPYKPHSE